MKKLIKGLLGCMIVVSTLFTLSGCTNDSKLDGIWIKIDDNNVDDDYIKEAKNTIKKQSENNEALYDVIFIEKNTYNYYPILNDSKAMVYDQSKNADQGKRRRYGTLQAKDNSKYLDIIYKKYTGNKVMKKGKMKLVDDNLLIVKETDNGSNAPEVGTYVRFK